MKHPAPLSPRRNVAAGGGGGVLVLAQVPVLLRDEDARAADRVDISAGVDVGDVVGHSGGGGGEPLEQREVVVLVGERGEAAPLAAAEQVAEEALELLAKDAVDDEVDGGVERDEEVGDRRQLRHLYVQDLQQGDRK